MRKLSCALEENLEALRRRFHAPENGDFVVRECAPGGVRMAVVSASPRADVLRNLRSAGAETYFDAIVSGDMGLPGKPRPDMYLRGAALVGVPIGQCAVLEDSPHGLRAGCDAGAYTIMIPDLRPYTDELAPICDCVCLTLREAGEAILCR